MVPCSQYVLYLLASQDIPLLPSAVLLTRPPSFDIVYSHLAASPSQQMLALPLLYLVVAIVCFLDMARLHHDLGRRPIDVLLEAYLPISCALSAMDRTMY